MRTVAYKLNYGITLQSLPANYIVEWTFVDLQPDNFDTSSYLLLPEDEFFKLLEETNTEENRKAFDDAFHAEVIASYEEWKRLQGAK